MALSANTDREYKIPGLKSFKVATAVHIYKGALVGVVKGTGYLVPVTDIADLEFVGIAYEEKNNDAGADGDLSCRVIMYGYHNMALSGAAVTNIGDYVYATDDDTVVTSGQANNVEVGQIVDFPFSGIVTVDISKRSKSVSQQSHIADPAACDAMTATGPAATATGPSKTAANPDAVTCVTMGDLVATNGGWGSSSEAGFDKITTAVDQAIADILTIRTQLVAAIVDVDDNNSEIDNLIIDVAANNTAIDALIVDVAALKAAVDINNACIDAIHVALEKAEIVASA